MLVVLDLVAVVLILFMIVVMVIMVIVAAMLMVVVMAVRALHAFDIFLVERVDVVHHARCDGDVLPCRVQHALDPVFALAAVVEEDIGFGDRDRVERGGLKAVRLASGGEEQRHVRAILRDGAGKVVIGKERRDDLEFCRRPPSPQAQCRR